jgi:membrane-associated protein
MDQLLHDLWLVVSEPLKLQENLHNAVQNSGSLTYILIFAIVFCETGLVVTPFLPGDSLLFIMGFLCASVQETAAANGTAPPIRVDVMALVLFVAALAGDNLNYQIGRAVGPLAFSGKYRWLKKKHLDRSHAFFEKHGGRAVVLARFVPIVRTFMPFVAGVAGMRFRRFLAFSVFGAALWIVLLMGAGYWLGGRPFVQAHFEKFVLGIVAVSLLPIVIEWWRLRRHAKAAKTP